MPDIYRRAASAIVLRPSPSGFRLLLLHKPRKKDAWQLPQGGVEEGETVEEAAARELFEEAGLRGEILGRSERVYQYDFPLSFRRFRPDNVRGQRIEYVCLQVLPDARITVDGREINAFAWASEADLPRYIRRKEYLQLVRKLLQEGIALWH